MHNVQEFSLYVDEILKIAIRVLSKMNFYGSMVKATVTTSIVITTRNQFNIQNTYFLAHIHIFLFVTFRAQRKHCKPIPLVCTIHKHKSPFLFKFLQFNWSFVSVSCVSSNIQILCMKIYARFKSASYKQQKRKKKNKKAKEIVIHSTNGT